MDIDTRADGLGDTTTHINLTSDYKRIAYGHWNALYERAGKRDLAHRWAKIFIARFPSQTHA